MLCSATYRYNDQHFLDAVPKISVKFSGSYFSDTLLAVDADQLFECGKIAGDVYPD